MSTAKELIPAFVEAEPLYWDRAYTKNMRPIRGYPNYWRIIDTEAFIDGPMEQGGQYSADFYPWNVKVLMDDEGDLTDTLEIRNLRNAITYTSNTVGGETTYRYRYQDVPADFSYTHTDIIDSVSLEFDQSGRRIVAFESNGDVYLIWYDTQQSQQVVTNWGAGYNPQVVTTTYRRRGGSGDSERLLFYVDSATNQIVYRRQNDRYGVVYTLPSAPQDIVELLKVSKNLYGGLTALYCYDDTAGSLETGSFTASYGEDQVAVGSDGGQVSRAEVKGSEGSITSFLLAEGLVLVTPTDGSEIIPNQGDITFFELRSATIFLNEQTDVGDPVVPGTGTVTDFELKSAIIFLNEQTDIGDPVVPGTGTVTDFKLKETLITLQASDIGDPVVPGTGAVQTFTLG